MNFSLFTFAFSLKHELMPEHTNNLPTKPDLKTNWSELDVRSDEVQEIIGRPPHWLIRWGITAFFGVLALVLLSASIIKYPDAIQAPLRLTAIHAPQTIKARINGKIVRMIAENSQNAMEDEILGWMESTASHEEVIRLSAEVDSMRNWLLNDRIHRFQPSDEGLSIYRNLGELQTSFQSFEQSYREYRSFLPGGYYERQWQILKQEMAYARQLLEKLYLQEQIRQRDYELAQQEYEMQKGLAENDHIATVEVARAESELCASRLPLQQTESAIINNQLTQKAKEKEIMELEKQMAEQRSVFLQAVNTMKSAIAEWKKTHLLIAPYEGVVVYAGVIQENQTLSNGQDVFYIQPENTQYFGEMAVSQQSFGKIEEGQQVQVRFSGYPSHEYGSVFGQVDYLSDFPVRDSLFFAKVSFPLGLVTNYGREIPPRNGMTGQAEIITQDMRLLQRVINNMTKELR